MSARNGTLPTETVVQGLLKNMNKKQAIAYSTFYSDSTIAGEFFLSQYATIAVGYIYVNNELDGNA